MFFDVFWGSTSGTTEVDKIIADAIKNDPLRVGQLGLKAFNAIVRRSLARVGVNINKELRKAFTLANPLGITPLRVHPLSGGIVALTTKKYRPRHGETGRVTPVTKPQAPGAAFRKAMNYHLIFEENRKELYIGAEVPSGSDLYSAAKKKPFVMTSDWQNAFRTWQQAGPVQSFGGESSRQYLAALGMPTSRSTFERPERDIIGRQQRRTQPLQLLEQALYERLNK